MDFIVSLVWTWGKCATDSFQIPVDNLEGVEVLKTFGDLQQLEELIREQIGYEAEEDSYQLWPRAVGMRLEMLHDVAVIAPVVDESELKY